MSVILNELILPSIARIGMRLEETQPYKNCGSTYSVLPEAGEGFYWVYGYQNQFAVAVSNLTLKKTVQHKYKHPAFYTIGSYDNASARIVSDQAGTANRILLGYSRPEAVFHKILHEGYSGKGVSISLSAPFAEELACSFDMSMSELTDKCFTLSGTEQVPGANTILRQVQLYTPTERFAHHYYKSKLMELLTILCQRHELNHPLWPKSSLRKEDLENLSRVTDYIHAHYRESFDLHDLSVLAYMGRTKLTETFKQIHGVTITQYVRQLRTEEAKDLLKGNQLSLGEIAAQVGYHTQGSFTDLFKEVTGLTPREYRSLFCGTDL